MSDDTQMTMFTANGLLFGITRFCTHGVLGADIPDYIRYAYQDWYRTQTELYRRPDRKETFFCSWLLNVPELYAQRAPGNTCMSAISSKGHGSVHEPINNSKGCGGVMRVAPIGLYYDQRHSWYTPLDIDMLGAEVAALTHGHEMGYIPAAMLVHIVQSAALCEGIPLKVAVLDSKIAMKRLFPESRELPGFLKLMDKAVELAESNLEDLAAIHQLGEGWVGDEALAIAVYCALKYSQDFDKALIAAVNHGGDSDSTGAITGNILGAYLGLSQIPQKYLEKLELRDILMELADDLYYDCQISEYKPPVTPREIAWEQKYVKAAYPHDEEHYNTKWVIGAYENHGQTISMLCFWRNIKKPDNGDRQCFGMWYPSEFTLDGVRYQSLEQYMMSQKALLFGDQEIYHQIMAPEHAGDYKALGRKVRNFEEKKWDAQKFQIAVTGNVAKFSQNPELKACLLSTGDQILVEASPYDGIWGVKLGMEDPKIQNPNNWQGQNLLGFALME
ncbi:MAG: ADP-ribosylglycohydrolase family protein, partial [Faecousia sp.]